MSLSELKPQGTVRERLLQTADVLFDREGIHTVGVDRILEVAGVARGSLYATFGSKEELVRAFLEGRAARQRERVEKGLSGIEDPRERALAVFDLFVERVQDGSYNGCPFVRACAESPLETNAASEVSGKHRAWRLDLFARLAEEWGSRDPGRIARQLSILYDGAAVAVGMDRDPAAAVAARDAVACLLEAQDNAPKRRSAKAPRSDKKRTK